MGWKRVAWYTIFGLWVAALTFGAPALGRQYVRDDKFGEWAAWGVGFVVSVLATVLIERGRRGRAEPGAAADTAALRLSVCACSLLWRRCG